MEYHEFLFYSLIKDIENRHPLKNMEYDQAFADVNTYYDLFSQSEFNDENKSEYDCIVEYLIVKFPSSN